MALGFEQAKACEIASRECKDRHLADFLSRFAQAVKAGEDVSDFLLREYDSFMVAYTSEYERSMVRLRRLCEAFSAVVSSISFLSVSLLLIAMFWGGSSLMLWQTLPVFILPTSLLTYILYRTSPVGQILSTTSKPQRLELLLKVAKKYDE